MALELKQFQRDTLDAGRPTPNEVRVPRAMRRAISRKLLTTGDMR